MTESAKTRYTAVAKYFEGKTLDQIAADLGLPRLDAEMVSSCTSACCNAVRPERCAQSCLFGSRRRGEDLVPVRMRAATYKMPEADFESVHKAEN